MANDLELAKDIKKLLSVYKLVHADEIEQRKQDLLRNEIKQEIYDKCSEPISAKDLARSLGKTPQNVYYHMNDLANMGLLGWQIEDGEKRYYQII